VKLNKEIQVDLMDFMPSPSMKESQTTTFEEKINRQIIQENNEENVIETLKNFEKMRTSLTDENEMRRNTQKVLDLIEIGKENLLENIELKRDLATLNEEMSHFVRDNKKLRFTYQNATSELEENKEKTLMLTENYKILEEKVSKIIVFSIIKFISMLNCCKV